jgi:hypothetical protein
MTKKEPSNFTMLTRLVEKVVVRLVRLEKITTRVDEIETRLRDLERNCAP